MSVKRLWHRVKGRGELYGEYVRRDKDREKDSINKPSAGLRMLFQNTIHVFEDLDREDLVSREIGGREMLEHLGKEYIEEYQRWH
ncbi:MAG: hypothetical protein ACO2O0_05225 [Desulfurococcales archaeon]|jgi:hypothetical protein